LPRSAVRANFPNKVRGSVRRAAPIRKTEFSGCAGLCSYLSLIGRLGDLPLVRVRHSLPRTSLTERNDMMKRVATILTTALLASSLLTAAEARGHGGSGDLGGGGHMADFGGGAHIGGIGAGGPTGGARMAVDVGVARGDMKGLEGNYIGRSDNSLGLHPHAMHHFRRFSPRIRRLDSDPGCNIEPTEGDEFPCFPR
jgi:hypothetical protein